MNDPHPDGHPTFDPWLERWELVPTGQAQQTPTGRLIPVSLAGRPAMLKVNSEPEERAGARVLAWWEGAGAAQVLAHADDAYLLELADGGRSLVAMASTGADIEATTILCQVAAELHAKDPADRPAAVSDLGSWFQALWPAAAEHGGELGQAASVAARLLDTQRDVVVLHGDLHHGNVLDFGDRGWLAIDPKGLFGERTFDYVNILRNPDAAVALAPGRFAQCVSTIAEVAGLDAVRLVEWALAFTALSAAWLYGDDVEPHLDLTLARLALQYLA